MSFPRHPVTGAMEITLQSTGSGTGTFRRFGPFRGKGACMIAMFSGTTNGASVKVQCSLTSGSTADVWVLGQRKSSQSNLQLATTAGANSNKFANFIRLSSTAGTFSASKTLAVRIVYIPGVST